MKLDDFGALTDAESKLIQHLRGGGVGICQISDQTPPTDAPPDLHIRASLIRALVLKQITDVLLPEKGLRVRGAFILGDGPEDAETMGLDLEGATLAHDLGLAHCCIPDPLILRSATVVNLNLTGSHLLGTLSADRLEAKGSVFLRRITSEGEIRLLGAKLGGDLDCDGATLNATDNALSADMLEAKGSVFLRGITSAGKIRLLGAKLGGDLDCGGATLNARGDALDLQGARIDGAWFWRNNAKSVGTLNLETATIGTICDDPACWPTEIRLNRCQYGAFVGKGVSAAERIDWLSRMTPQAYDTEFWPQPYEECARVLREAGHGADARDVLIEKERLQRAVRQQRLRRAYRAGGRFHFAPYLQSLGYAVADGLLKYTVAYGRKPLQAAVPLLFLLLIGANIFAISALAGQIKPNLPQIQRAPEWVGCAIPQGQSRGNPPVQGRALTGQTQMACFLSQPEAASYPRFDALVYSADTLLPIVSLEMQSYWIPDDRKPFGGWARLYLWLHIMSGWGLTLLAVAGFSGLVKSDNSK
ncbi:MAG: hypothetical protein Q4G14_08525 [Paracoccus sp. (in: a-proteobacteria)]|uniref:hypothetical protein n=1 Tax=Paracoccus sp. TaxID=267 RepID=UPI0026DFB7C6|nr:hypothetical protein [Paracoccus sp. (in: a-proteobacteria)]MDO5613271.1 hypothetical protein [Paracoccus sp. (in: a-proteobacteria)]